MLILQTILENLTSRKDGTYKLTFGTQELSPDDIKEVAGVLNKFCFLGIKADEFKSTEIEILSQKEASEFDDNKTQGQRIRAVLFKLYSQNNEGFNNFDSFYKSKTEKYIEHLKSKIE